MALWSQGECVAVDVAGERVEGRVWAYDGPNGVVVLQVPSKRQQLEFRLINVRSLPRLAPSPAARDLIASLPVAVLPPFDASAAKRREQEALNKAAAAADKVGQGVTREAQELFNAVEHLYPQTKWAGTTIRVLGLVDVAAPYAQARPTQGAPPNPDLLRLVQNIVEAHRRRKEKQ